MFNNIFSFLQKKSEYLYNNSFILRKIDVLILFFILLTLFSSMYMSSDSIGFFALISIFLTFIKFVTCPNTSYKFKNFEIWLLAYFMIVVISLCGSTLFGLSLKGFFKTFVYMGFYLSTLVYLKYNPKKILVLIGSIALFTTIEGLIGVFQSTLHLDAISTWQDTSRLNPEDVLSRVYGTLKPLNPNLYGGYLVSGLSYVIFFLFYGFFKKNYNVLMISSICLLVDVYAIFQTGCRGAYLATMLIFGCVFILSAKFFWNTYKKVYLSIIGSICGLFVLVLMFVNSIRLRFLSIFAMRNDSSNSFRFNVYQSSVQMFKDNWLLGIGVGNKNFREVYGLYMKTGFDALSAYNIFLEIAVESGIFALIAFTGFLLSISYTAVKNIIKSSDQITVSMLALSIISVWAVMFHGLVDTVFFRPQLQFVFWTNVGIISTLLTHVRHESGISHSVSSVASSTAES